MIVITGGAGFIGSNLAAGLNDAGRHDLVLVDVLGDGDKWRNIAKREFTDILSPDEIFDFLDDTAGEVEAIFHMGARSATTERDADLVVELNFRYTMALWDWCAGHDTRFVYASSGATYGDGSYGFDDGGSLDDLAKLRPLNLYGWSKHVTDRRIARLIAEDAPRPPQWTGLKFFNVYGPNERHKGPMRSVASQLFDQITATGRARLFRSHRDDVPDGGQRRDFIWVGDCVDVMLWLLDTPDVSGLFNVGTGVARSFKDVAEATFAAMGREPAIDFIDTPEDIRANYQYFTEANVTRLRAAGYDRPFTTLEDGVGDYVRRFLATDDPYR